MCDLALTKKPNLKRFEHHADDIHIRKPFSIPLNRKRGPVGCSPAPFTPLAMLDFDSQQEWDANDGQDGDDPAWQVCCRVRSKTASESDQAQGSDGGRCESDGELPRCERESLREWPMEVLISCDHSRCLRRQGNETRYVAGLYHHGSCGEAGLLTRLVLSHARGCSKPLLGNTCRI